MKTFQKKKKKKKKKHVLICLIDKKWHKISSRAKIMCHFLRTNFFPDYLETLIELEEH